jgi:hypothetical protein
MSAARKANPRDLSSVTSQGFYVLGADGTAYGFNNNRDPERVLSFIKKGMDEFRAAPPRSVDIEADDAGYTRKPSEPVTAIRVFSRIKPLPEGCDILNHSVGRDHFWMYRSDVEAIAKGKGKFKLPEPIALRLVKYHLVDNVRGEPSFWSPTEVKKADFQVVAKGNDVYTLTGTYSMATADQKRGLRGVFEGEIRIDPAKMAVTRFRGYGEAKAWGAGPYTPRPPEGEFPLVFALVNVDDEFSRSTPPQGAAYGDSEYRRGM